MLLIVDSCLYGDGVEIKSIVLFGNKSILPIYLYKLLKLARAVCSKCQVKCDVILNQSSFMDTFRLI